jgi:branched-chain amino acid transport system ATP-binding protein
MLDVRSVSKSFGGLKAVDGINLSIAEGEIVGLIGPNGAGKTTLFNCIAGAFPVTAGQILLRGNDLTGFSAHRVCRAGLARTHQIVKPFGGLTVLDNVVVGALNQTADMAKARRIAEETLEITGLAHRARDQASSLPLPGRKRLEISRALATGPKVLLLDEVMAGLNPTEVEQAIGLIQRIRDSGISLLVIEHLMRVILSVSDKIVVMHHGQKLAEGLPQDIIKNPVVIKAYLGEEFSA